MLFLRSSEQAQKDQFSKYLKAYNFYKHTEVKVYVLQTASHPLPCILEPIFSDLKTGILSQKVFNSI